ncbi:hypothetical protein [Acidovorax cavernicola]|uniref:Uncharacterized protein n=1 Tax=Acidovorax cavernicola TaxID=1675792 RepID=A0A9X8D7Z0_9BURK|nr:hypothetical protein [Acidovorax cavernicola]RIX84015.1 hypothetical protein D3H34_04645 [Acidovorax cavernicola]
MRWNALVHIPYESEREAPPRRWWLGWLQLLCAWVLLMLLCANIALVFAEGLPGTSARTASHSYNHKTMNCTLRESAAPQGTRDMESTGPAQVRAHRC